MRYKGRHRYVVKEWEINEIARKYDSFEFRFIKYVKKGMCQIYVIKNRRK